LSRPLPPSTLDPVRGTYFAATLALLVNLAPSRVAACYGCYGAISAKPVFGASVPADGVLAFAFEGEHPTAAAVSLRRLGGDGAELAVALESLGSGALGSPLLVARPLAPLDVGATYEVTLSAANDEITRGESDCELSPHFEVVVTVLADPPGLVAPRVPELDVSFTVDVVSQLGADAEVVCCSRHDDPVTFSGGCGYGTELGDRCTSTVGFGVLRAEIHVDASAWDPQGQIYIEGLPAGATAAFEEVGWTFCVTPAARSLATGARAEGPAICPDSELTRVVGEHPRDPAEILPCRSFWSCWDSEAGWWDSTECRRVRPEGCACRAGDGDPATFALVVLLLLGRSRRRVVVRELRRGLRAARRRGARRAGRGRPALK